MLTIDIAAEICWNLWYLFFKILLKYLDKIVLEPIIKLILRPLWNFSKYIWEKIVILVKKIGNLFFKWFKWIWGKIKNVGSWVDKKTKKCQEALIEIMKIVAIKIKDFGFFLARSAKYIIWDPTVFVAKKIAEVIFKILKFFVELLEKILTAICKNVIDPTIKFASKNDINLLFTTIVFWQLFVILLKWAG